MTTKIDCLMLIDDNKIDQLHYERIISRSGLVEKTISFYFAEEALEYLKDNRNQKPNMIFLDVKMPRMDGFEFLDHAVGQFGPDALSVVVMLTTSLDPRDRARARGFSCVKDFQNKPLTEATLSQALKHAAPVGAAAHRVGSAPTDQAGLNLDGDNRFKTS